MNRSQLFLEISTKIEGLRTDLKSEIQSLRDSFENDTKSSAGDKYETSREMTQQEIAKLELSFQQKTMQLNLLNHYSNLVNSEKIQLGSILETDQGIFLLGVPFGKLELNTITIFGLGNTAPLSALFLKASKGESTSLNGTDYVIKNLY